MQELRAVGRTYPIHDAAEKVTGDLVFGTTCACLAWCARSCC